MPALKDLTGQVFGRLTVLERAPTIKGRTMWHCKCECGNECDIRADQLTGGMTKSCGCLHRETAQQIGKNNIIDLTGKTFGKLTVLYQLPERQNGKIVWMCKCACGTIKPILGTSLTYGNTQSCGCQKSQGEAIIEQILIQNSVSYKSQYHIKINGKNYYYDFAILQENKVIRFIEFDGPQHEGRISGWFTQERYNQLKESDLEKNKYALAANIPLVRIPYNEKSNLNLEMLMSDTFLVKFNN